jgi:hypothetical protein
METRVRVSQSSVKMMGSDGDYVDVHGDYPWQYPAQ